MKGKKLLIVGAILCLFGILAIPAAALVSESQVSVSGNNRIDPGLRKELWEIHTKHRIARYDMNIQTAGEIIEALNKYGHNTSAISETLNEITGKREALVNALDDRDWNALKNVNLELVRLWREFRKELRQLFKDI